MLQQFTPNFLPGGGVAGAATGVGTVVAVIGTILGALFGPIFGGGSDANTAIAELRDQVFNIGNTLTQLLVSVARALGKALVFLGSLLWGLVRPLINLLGKILEKLADLYFKYLKPIIEAIQKIRLRILKIYERFLRPILLMFQRLHQVLTILKLFHLKFAAKLDAELSRLEAKLIGPMYQLLHYLNLVANMLNLVFDSTLVMRRAVTLNALDQTKGTWTRMFWDAQTSAVSDAELSQAQADGAAQSQAQTVSDFQQWALNDTGPYTQIAADALTTVQNYG